MVGTVTKATASALTVEDFGGAAHQVKLTDETSLTAPIKHREIKAGDTVTVVGSTSGDTVTATKVTIS